jgi:membrane-bound lytic murein transglycosylase A
VSVPFDLEPTSFDALHGFASDNFSEAFACFFRSARQLVSSAPPLRPGLGPRSDLVAVAQAAIATGGTLSGEEARTFFTSRFRPFTVRGQGFVTAYYEPEVEARLTPEPEFAASVLPRPPDLVTLNETPIRGPAGESLTSARRCADGTLVPYFDRRAIEDDPNYDRAAAIAYVRDRVELFFMQVQGSARLRLPGGRLLALTYDGRNGHPYTSIGRLLIERGIVPQESMSLGAVKEALRSLGQDPGAPGRLLMQENRSYVFFRQDESEERRLGPIGGAGCALTPLRSIAVDRSIWSYGLPFWIETAAPWRGAHKARFERLMIAQDTGSAILGPARADLFYGCGDDAGALAGMVRHSANFAVLLPRSEGVA